MIKEYKLPKVPDKDRVLELLKQTHGPSIPHWTSSDKEDVYNLLYSLAFYYYRTEKILEINNDR